MQRGNQTAYFTNRSRKVRLAHCLFPKNVLKWEFGWPKNTLICFLENHYQNAVCGLAGLARTINAVQEWRPRTTDLFYGSHTSI